MSTPMARAPWWYWAVAVLALLWMLLGVFAWTMDLRMTPEQLAALSPGRDILGLERFPAHLLHVHIAAIGTVACRRISMSSPSTGRSRSSASA